MDRYEPPFDITNRMLSQISAVSEKLGMIAAYRSLDTKPQLRRNNRIKSVHSSLKIESSSLSEGMVRSVLNNRAVIGPEKEIQEVKNAFAAYDYIGKVNPYSIDALKELHGVMTYLTVDESGVFRRGAEGVFDGDRCIFMAPPPDMVEPLMLQLFDWMKENSGTIHPLILSCVFHYEFVFIHPFSDGNGRMARLWQTIMLTEWNPVFQYIPLESQIETFQDGYYNAIASCNANGNSNDFIEFMLDRIYEVLDAVLKQSGEYSGTSKYVSRLLSAMEYDTEYSANELLALLGLKSKETLRHNYIDPAIESGFIDMTLPDKPTSRNQRYRKK